MKGIKTKKQLSKPSPAIDFKSVNALKEINRLESEIKKLELKLISNRKERNLMKTKLQAYTDKLEIMKNRWNTP